MKQVWHCATYTSESRYDRKNKATFSIQHSKSALLHHKNKNQNGKQERNEKETIQANKGYKRGCII